MNVANLSADRVAALLSCGARPPAATAAWTVLELFSEPPDRPAGRLLSSLAAELQAPAVPDAPCPLSFSELLQLDSAERQELAGRSLLDALVRADASPTVLEKLAAYGELLSDDRFLIPQQLTGVVVHALAQGRLARHHGAAVEPGHRETTLAVLEALASCPTLPDAVQTSAGQLAEELGQFFATAAGGPSQPELPAG